MHMLAPGSLVCTLPARIAERKKRFPTRANVEKRRKEEEEASARGESNPVAPRFNEEISRRGGRGGN